MSARGRRRVDYRPLTTAERVALVLRAVARALDAAGTLDASARTCRGQRRALLATLIFAGLRIGEALTLARLDVDLARGTITVRASKTDAGVRIVYILPVLRDELGAYLATIDLAPAALVFGSSTGKRQSASNIRRRVLAKAVTLANKQAANDGTEALPEKLTLTHCVAPSHRCCSPLARRHLTSWRRWGTQHRASRWRSTHGRWTAGTASRSA